MPTGNKDDWQPIGRARAYEQVLEQIEERILDGRLAAGDHLPSEREFAATLGISRPSIREALRVIEALGIVQIKRGAGRDSGAVLVSSPGDGLMNLLKLQIALATFSWDDVLNTRMALEIWCVEEAAWRADKTDHAELTEILDRMDAPEIDSAEFNRLDAAFHVRIAESTGNALTAHFMGSLRTAIHHQMVKMYAELEDWRETAKTVRAEHRAILEAVVSGDRHLAADRMRRHIADFYDIATFERADPARP